MRGKKGKENLRNIIRQWRRAKEGYRKSCNIDWNWRRMKGVGGVKPVMSKRDERHRAKSIENNPSCKGHTSR